MHGVRSIVVEQNATTTRHPKMDLTNGRSMELYRRMGVVDKLRAAGVPEDNPFGIVWVTKPGGHELHRVVYPTSRQSRALAAQVNDGAQTLEPGMRISQVVLEPVLKAFLDDSPLVDLRFGWTFESLKQDGTGVTSVIRNSETGVADVLRTDYVAGCDRGGTRPPGPDGATTRARAPSMERRGLSNRQVTCPRSRGWRCPTSGLRQPMKNAAKHPAATA